MAALAKWGFIICGMFLASSVIALTIDLPADKEVHRLNIDTEEEVVIRLHSHARLEGIIKTRAGVRIEPGSEKAKGRSIWLAPTLQLMSETENAYSSLQITGLGNTYIYAPIKVKTAMSIHAEAGSRIEIHNHIRAGDFSILIEHWRDDPNPLNTGVFISEGVAINVEWFYTNSSFGSFTVAKGAQINSLGSLRIKAFESILVEGELNSKGSVSVYGWKTAAIKLGKLTALNTDPLGHLDISVIGREIDILEDVLSNADRVLFRGSRVNFYDKTISADYDKGEIIFNPTTNKPLSILNAYGGLLSAKTVCISMDFNNYGLTDESARVCES